MGRITLKPQTAEVLLARSFAEEQIRYRVAVPAVVGLEDEAWVEPVLGASLTKRLHVARRELLSFRGD